MTELSRNRQMMMKALAERGFVPQPPPAFVDPLAPIPRGAAAGAQPAPFPAPRPALRPAPPPQARDDDWTIGDSFTPQGLAAAAGEGARFFGEVLAPIGRVASDAGRSVVDGVRQFGDNLAARDNAERAIRDRYMPAIRQANANATRSMAAYDALDRIEMANADDAESRMDGLNADLSARIATPAPIGRATALPPEEMSDEELFAALRARRAMR